MNKLIFYSNWFKEMRVDEKNSKVGRWVYENIKIYTAILKEIDASVGRWSEGSTNYKGNFNGL